MTKLETIRPGVTFEADAAASFRRLEAEVGTIPCNSTYRDPVQQDRMHAASVAYEAGRGPYPGHSYAVASKDSYHCAGEAFDSPRSKSIRPAARRHGWVHVTRAGEEHHLERRAELDQHRGQPAPASTTGDTMAKLDDEDREFITEQIANHSNPSGAGYTYDAVTYPIILATREAVARIESGRILFAPDAGYTLGAGIVGAIREGKMPTSDVDEEALARALAPLISLNVNAISDGDLQRLAETTAAELAKRLAS